MKFVSLVFLLVGFVAQASAEKGSDCNQALGGGYTLLSKSGAELSRLKFGDPVQILLPQAEPQRAYFVGTVDDRVYFSPRDMHSIHRPLFYLQKFEINISTTNTELIQIQSTQVEDSCGPQTVLACLDHLGRLGLLPEATANELQSHRIELFEEMQKQFSRGVLSKTPEQQELFLQHMEEMDRKKSKDLVAEMRNMGFSRILKLLSDRGIPARVTASHRELMKHLSSGLPAYISVSATGMTFEKPSLADFDKESSEIRTDIQFGTYPIPQWAPSYAGFHAVYALGVLPRSPGFGGLLMGKRVVIMDPEMQGLTIWNSFSLRFAGTARYILIGNK